MSGVDTTTERFCLWPECQPDSKKRVVGCRWWFAFITQNSVLCQFPPVSYHTTSRCKLGCSSSKTHLSAPFFELLNVVWEKHLLTSSAHRHLHLHNVANHWQGRVTPWFPPSQHSYGWLLHHQDSNSWFFIDRENVFYCAGEEPGTGDFMNWAQSLIERWKSYPLSSALFLTICSMWACTTHRPVWKYIDLTGFCWIFQCQQSVQDVSGVGGLGVCLCENGWVTWRFRLQAGLILR